MKSYIEKEISKTFDFSLNGITLNSNNLTSYIETGIKKLVEEIISENDEIEHCYIEDTKYIFKDNKVTILLKYSVPKYDDNKIKVYAWTKSFNGLNDYTVFLMNDGFVKMNDYIEENDFVNMYDISDAIEFKTYEETKDFIKKSEFNKEPFIKPLQKMAQYYGYMNDIEVIMETLNDDSLKETFMYETPDSMTDTAPRDIILYILKKIAYKYDEENH